MKFTLDGYDFVGYIDLLLRDKRDGKIVVLDHKSTEYPFKLDGGIKKKLQDSFAKYKKQMYLYAYAVHEEYGEYPKEMTWHHFKDGGKLATIPFKKKNMMTLWIGLEKRLERLRWKKILSQARITSIVLICAISGGVANITSEV
jgi:hypothetical protein